MVKCALTWCRFSLVCTCCCNSVFQFFFPLRLAGGESFFFFHYNGVSPFLSLWIRFLWSSYGKRERRGMRNDWWIREKFHLFMKIHHRILFYPFFPFNVSWIGEPTSALKSWRYLPSCIQQKKGNIFAIQATTTTTTVEDEKKEIRKDKKGKKHTWML